MVQQLAALLAAVSVISAPNIPASAGEDTLSALLAETNAAHAKLDAPRADLFTYRYEASGSKPTFTLQDGALLQAYDGKDPDPAATLSAQDAKAETEWLFRLLRMQYGLYQWSGGDAAFETAQRAILSALPQNGTMTLGDYEKLLTTHLDFIKDAHFMIGSTNMWHVQQVFSDEARPFYRKDGVFYADAACTRKVISVNGQTPDKLIHRAIGQQGELTYYLYTFAPKAESLRLSVQYTDKTEEVTLHPAASFEATESTVDRFGNTLQNGLPRVTINEMFFGDGDSSGWANLNDEAYKQKVLKTADEIKSYPAALIDISRNPGGNGDLPMEWFRRYTGQDAQPNYCTLRIRASETWLKSGYGAKTAEDIASLLASQDAYFESSGLTADGNYYVGIPSAQFVENNGPTLFVLTSRATQSAAENFTDVLHNLQNTVTIGSNTGGVLTNGANYGLKLPYSGLAFQFGECLFLWDKAYFEEGRGIAPDIYLTGDNLDTRLDAFLSRYVSGGK